MVGIQNTFNHIANSKIGAPRWSKCTISDFCRRPHQNTETRIGRRHSERVSDDPQNDHSGIRRSGGLSHRGSGWSSRSAPSIGRTNPSTPSISWRPIAPSPATTDLPNCQALSPAIARMLIFCVRTFGGTMNGRSTNRQTRAIRPLRHPLPPTGQVAQDRESRALLREMAAEWLKLAEVAG